MKLKRPILLITLITTTLLSCQNSRPDEIISEQSRFADAYMTVDTLRIALDYDQKFIYPKFGTVRHEDSLYFIGYNDFKHAFDVFNLDSRSFLKRIQLEKDGPNGISDVIGFTPIGIDCLYVLSSFQLSRVISDGSIESKLSLNSGASKVRGHDPDEFMFWLETDEPLLYDNTTNSIYGLNHSYIHGQCHPKRFIDSDMIAKLDLNKNRLSTLPIQYPKSEQGNCHGFLSKIYTTRQGDQIIYNWAFDPNIYVHTLHSGVTRIFDGKSDFTDNSVAPVSWSECPDFTRKLDHYVREVNFEKVISDNTRNLYYRFHRKELSRPDISGSDYNEKKLFLTVFDDSFAKTQEFILDNRHYPTHVSFADKKGLYVAAPEESDETMVFYIFDVHTIPRKENENTEITELIN